MVQIQLRNFAPPLVIEIHFALKIKGYLGGGFVIDIRAPNKRK
jgi:hypothetical protein